MGRRRGSRPPLGIISAASRTSVAVGLGEVRDGGERVRVPLAERLGKKGTCRGHVVDVSWTCRVRGVRVERRDASVELRAEQRLRLGQLRGGQVGHRVREQARLVERWGGVGRDGERWGDGVSEQARLVEIWGGVGRDGEMWGE